MVGPGEGAVGPGGEGELAPPANLDDAKDLEEGMSRLLALARALAALEAAGKLPRGIVSSGVLFAPVNRAGDASASGAAVLLAPPAITAKALIAGGAEARAAAVSRLGCPDSKGAESDASFFLAQAAYFFATGRHAFEREAGEASGLAGPRPSSAPAMLASPRLDRGLAALVDKALADPNAASLAEWLEVLAAASGTGFTRKLAPELEAELSARAQALEAQDRARRRRADFLRKRGGVLIAAAVVLAVALVIGLDIARAQRDRPDFSALSPPELVHRYYQAIDGLDLEALEACGDKKAIKADDDMVISLVVVTRTRTAYEGKNPLVRAADWVAAGKPSLGPTDFLYGLVGLSISEDASSSPDRPVFRAEYSLWTIERADSSIEAASLPAELRRSDLVTLARAKKGWRIVGLERG